jgi:phospholipid/cholesterol/gamma-HCH transport system permease protein
MIASELKVRAIEEPGRLVLALAGVLDSETSPGLAARLGQSEVGDHPRIVLDLAGLDRIDSTGVAVILEARERLAERQVELKLRRASDRVRRVFKLTLSHAGEAVEHEPAPPPDVLSRVGEFALQLKNGAAEGARQMGEIVYAIAIGPFRGERIRVGSSAQQVALIGADAVPIVSLIALLMGLIMGMQGAHQLRQFGASIFVADLVGIAATREIGPFITAILVAGRSGSAIAAELGTMVVTEEIDALKTMGLHPTRYLVVPRVLALTIALPCLAVIADAITILGGMLIGVFHLGIGVRTYFDQTIQAIVLSDFVTGLIKAVVFGVIIANVGVFEGLNVRGGAEGVGRATTRAVVSSITLIIIADAIFTAIFHFT